MILVSQRLQENWDSQAWIDHTIQKDWKSVGVTRSFLPLGILWLTVLLWIKRRSVWTRWAWYLHKLWWHIWKSMISQWENHCFLATSKGSCHPCPHTFMVWPKMPQNGKSMYSLWSLKPSVPYVPRNVTTLHTPQLVWISRSYLDIRINPNQSCPSLSVSPPVWTLLWIEKDEQMS